MCLKLAGLYPPHHLGGKDELIWLPSANGECSVKATYDTITLQENQPCSKLLELSMEIEGGPASSVNAMASVP